MWNWALPAIFAIFLWWFGTIVVLYLNGVSRVAARRAFWLGTGLAILALAGVVGTREATDAAGAYVAFTCAVVIWGWHELGYYAGMVTGPSAAPCSPGASGWRRFREGVRTCLHHELAIIATAVVLAALTWRASNPVALWAFAILWLMRWSAKLNIFLGVRNLHEEFWPRHLAYLSTYTRTRRMNALFPVTLLIAGTVLAMLIGAAGDAASASAIAARVLCATLLALAIIEHCLLMLPVPDEKLWRLGQFSRSAEGEPRAPASAEPAKSA